MTSDTFNRLTGDCPGLSSATAASLTEGLPSPQTHGDFALLLVWGERYGGGFHSSLTVALL